MRAGIRGLIVTAAFIGPGTVTTATMVGAQTGYALVWFLIFAIAATFTLQEMASRLGTVSGIGLSQAIMQCLPNKSSRIMIGALIIAAIGIGNAAYEGGNITGAALGLSASFGGEINTWAALLGTSALLLLASGQYKVVEKVLIALVMLMSVVFIILMFYVGINTSLLLDGLLLNSPIISHATLALAIIGTTIVPYNLFLHAGLSATDATANKATSNTIQIDARELKQQRTQLLGSISLGGLVTFALLSSSVTAFFITQVSVDPGNISNQFRPLLGDNAGLFFGVGLFASGLTSAITAPLAGAYAIAGLFGWRSELSDRRFLFTALLIVIVGSITASLGIKPLALILVAQTANALLLPISAILLLWVCNQKNLLGVHVNNKINNTLGVVVVLLVLVLASLKLF